MSPKASEIFEKSTGRKKLFWFAVGFVVFSLLFLILKGGLFFTVSSGMYVIRQPFPSGELVPYTKEGMYWRGFGLLWEYKTAGSYAFELPPGKNPETPEDQRIEIRFSDGGRAWISGNVRFIIPAVKKDFITLHKQFRSYDNVSVSTVKQVVIESVILTASLMTAEDSYATKRSMFSEIAWDQVKNGTYLTTQKIVEEVNPVTREKSIRTITEIQLNPDGTPKRKETPLKTYNIELNQFIITAIKYDENVEGQIQAKRTSVMNKITSQADAELAIQERITAEEAGKMNVVVEQYKAEVDKIKAVVDAQRDKEVGEIGASKELKVAQLDAQAASQEKLKKGFEAEGNYQFNRLKLLGDSALEAKLKLIADINEYWAQAFAKSPRAVVSAIVLGSSGKGGSIVEDILKLFTAKTAKELVEQVSKPKKE